MGHVGLKTRTLGQILVKLCIGSGGHTFSLILMKVGQNICLNKVFRSSKIGHVRSKTSSLSQIIEKPCVCSRGHISSVIVITVGQNVCLNEILDEFEKWVMLGPKLSDLKKNLCTL